MSLPGTGAIIIWNDIAPEGRDEFYDWHLKEHIPERLSVPGFLSGRRYIAISGETKPEFLTLYVTRDETIAMSAPYLDRLNAPTPWTKRATAHFRNTSRALTRVVSSQGAGAGGIMGTLKFDGTDARRAATQRVERQSHALQSIARIPRICGVHTCVSDLAASEAKTAESRERADILAAPSGAVLIEGCDDAAVAHAMRELSRILDLVGDPGSAGMYRLEYAMSATERP